MPTSEARRPRSSCDRLEALAAAGGTVVVVGNDEHVCGLIGLADAVRPEATGECSPTCGTLASGRS